MRDDDLGPPIDPFFLFGLAQKRKNQRKKRGSRTRSSPLLTGTKNGIFTKQVYSIYLFSVSIVLGDPQTLLQLYECR